MEGYSVESKRRESCLGTCCEHTPPPSTGTGEDDEESSHEDKDFEHSAAVLASEVRVLKAGIGHAHVLTLENRGCNISS